MSSTALSDENIRNFATAWYRALDIHAPMADCSNLLAQTGLEMIFPEKTLIGLGDFEAWYAGGTYSDGTDSPGVINIFFDENHTVLDIQIDRSSAGEEVAVEVIVGWQASWFEPPAAKSKRTSMNATQRWTVRPCPPERNEFGLEITSYNAMAKPFEYAPGFARL